MNGEEAFKKEFECEPIGLSTDAAWMDGYYRGFEDALEKASSIVEDSSLPDAYSEPCLGLIAEEVRELIND